MKEESGDKINSAQMRSEEQEEEARQHTNESKVNEECGKEKGKVEETKKESWDKINRAQIGSEE